MRFNAIKNHRKGDFTLSAVGLCLRLDLCMYLDRCSDTRLDLLVDLPVDTVGKQGHL